MLWKALSIGVFDFVVALFSISMTRPSYEGYQQDYQQNDNSSTSNGTHVNENWTAIWKRTKSDPVAFFTAVLAVATSALFALGLAQIGFLIRADRTAIETAKAATEAANVAKENLIAANRAWLAPTNAVLMKPIEDGLPIKIQVHIVNVGREPAIGVVWKVNPIQAPYIPLRDGSAEPTIGPNRSCEGLSARPADGLVIYPPGGANYWLPYEIEDNPANKEILDAVVARQSSLVIEGCFICMAGNKQRVSAFRFFLRDVPGESSYIVKNGKAAQNWNFNAMLTGNEAD